MAIGVDEQLVDLRAEPGHHPARQRLLAQHDEPFIAAAEPTALTAGED
jgi:hypothetical protein